MWCVYVCASESKHTKRITRGTYVGMCACVCVCVRPQTTRITRGMCVCMHACVCVCVCVKDIF